MKQILEVNVPEGYKAVIKIVSEESDTQSVSLPKSWEDFRDTHPSMKNEYFISSTSRVERSDALHLYDQRSSCDKNLLPSKELAEAMLALCQLIQLRDCYNDGWKPDWSDLGEDKFIIYFYKNRIALTTNYVTSHILYFKTEDLRDKFASNFSDLIETAKPLL